jgi:superoxide reductase
MAIGELYQSADWKKEKHVPVIKSPETVKAGEIVEVKVTVGEEVAHPNTTAHHIRWIDLYFQPEGVKFPYQIGKIEFTAHGASTEGEDTSTIYTHHRGTINFKTGKSGTLYAASFCNIHGLWESSRKIKVE